MAKVTWLGNKDEADISLVWNGVNLFKGVAVDVTDEHMLGKMRANPSVYKVEERTHVEIKEGKEEQEIQIKEGKEAYDYRQAEKGSGYAPVKKRVRKPKAEPTEPAT